MRLIVWEYIPMPFDGYSHISGKTVLGWLLFTGSSLQDAQIRRLHSVQPQDYTNTVINLLEVLPHKTFEIQQMYLSTRTFYFAKP